MSWYASTEIASPASTAAPTAGDVGKIYQTNPAAGNVQPNTSITLTFYDEQSAIDTPGAPTVAGPDAAAGRGQVVGVVSGGDDTASVRVVVRPSGTEPVVRVMVEGPDQETVERHARRLAEVVARELAL